MKGKHGLFWVAIVLWPLFATSCSNEPIYIEFVASLSSGAASELGFSGREALLLAVSSFNELGGIRGRPVEIRIWDDHGDPELSAELFKDIKEIGGRYVVGPMTSNILPAISTHLDESDPLFFVSPTISTPLLSNKDDTFFRVYPDLNFTAKILAEQISALDCATVSMVYDTSNEKYTIAMVDSVREYLSTMSDCNRVIGPLAISPNISNGESTIKAIIDGRSDVVFAVTTGLTMGLLAQNLHKAGYSGELIASNWSYTQDLIATGGTSVEGLRLVSIPVNDLEDVLPGIKDMYRDQTGLHWNFAASTTVEAFLILAQALEQYGLISPTQLQGALSENPFTLESGNISFDSFGDVIRPLDVIEVSGNQFRVVN